MPKTSDAHIRAVKKYQTEKVARIAYSVPRAKKAQIIDFAKSHGYASVNKMIDRAVDDLMGKG